MFKTRGMFLEKLLKKCYQIKSEFKCGGKQKLKIKKQKNKKNKILVNFFPLEILNMQQEILQIFATVKNLH